MDTRRSKNIRTIGGLALVAIAVMIAACGADDSSAETTGDLATSAAPTSAIDSAPDQSTTEAPHPPTTIPDTTVASTSTTTTTPDDPGRPTIVLVHGAFAGPTSWDAVAEILRQDGLDVVVPENPLRGPTIDAAAVREALDTIDGDVILVGHSYGGIPITNAATGDPDVRALVYVAAYVPDEGETFSQIQAQVPGQLTPDKLVITPYTTDDGVQGAEAMIAAEAFAQVFAADVPEELSSQLAAEQHPLDLVALDEPSGPPAWQDIPSYYLLATDDQIIPTQLARRMAERAGANVEEIGASHAVLISQPEAVADLIIHVAG